MRDKKILFFPLLVLATITTASFSVVEASHSDWTPIANDSPAIVGTIIKSEVDKQGDYTDPKEAEANAKITEKEKEKEDNAYKNTIAAATEEFNKAKNNRDIIVDQFKSFSMEYDDLHKDIKTIRVSIDNSDALINRHEQDIKSRQDSLMNWLKTEKQADAVVAVIYTRGFRDTLHDLDAQADAESVPLMAETMGTYVESKTTVVNNVAVRDFIKAVKSGTAHPWQEEPLRIELAKGTKGTDYLRIKRYELFPFKAPDNAATKGSSSSKMKIMVIRSFDDLKKFLSKYDYSPGNYELSKMKDWIAEAAQNSNQAANSLADQVNVFNAAIADIQQKIQVAKGDKDAKYNILQKKLPQVEKMKADLDALNAKKEEAEKALQVAQTALQEKKRVRESLNIMSATAHPQGGQAPADAIAAAIIDKLEEVRNEARTQHSSQTTTVVNYQLAGETYDRSATEAHITGIKLISFVLNEGDTVKVKMAFRVKTSINDTVKQGAALVKRQKSLRPQDCIKAAKLTEGIGELIKTDLTRAETNLREAVSICDTSASLHYNLGVVSTRLKKYNEAETELQIAIQLNPDFTKASEALAYLHSLSKKGKKGKSVSATPAVPQDCVKAAKLTEGIGPLMESKPVVAEDVLRQAIDICNQSVSLHYNLGVLLFREQKYDEAASVFEKAIQLKPDYAKALYALAQLNVESPHGDRERAKQLIETVLKQDPKNRQYQNMLAMLTGTVDTPPKSSVSRPDAIAVVIGNKNYRNSVLPPVTYAVNDASTVKQYLIDSFGFDEKNVIEIDDAANIDFVKYFGNESDYKGLLYNRVRKDKSEIFIYYSGHGAPDTNTKKAYLVPVDADPTVIKLTGYSLDVLYENLRKLNSDKNPKNITLVLDSCFSGGSNSGMIIPEASPIFIETTTPFMSLDNAVVLTSSKGTQISSWYAEKNHGLFTYFFLKNIKDAIEHNKQLTALDMEKALQGPDSVNDYALKLYNREQEPQVLGNKKLSLVP
jgi:tetratricopeptide (TPR) repeat protein